MCLSVYPLQEINYDSARGGVSVITEKGEITTSYLLIQRARISDSGKYTCSPTHANPQTVNVHVLNGNNYRVLSSFKSHYKFVRVSKRYYISTNTLLYLLAGEEPAAIQRGSLMCPTFHLPFFAVVLLLVTARQHTHYCYIQNRQTKSHRIKSS